MSGLLSPLFLDKVAQHVCFQILLQYHTQMQFQMQLTTSHIFWHYTFAWICISQRMCLIPSYYTCQTIFLLTG